MENLKDAAVMILAGLGITFQPNLYLGGLFLALGLTIIVRQYSEELRKTPRGLALATSLFLATVGGIASHYFAPQLPITLVMAAIGPFSVPLVKKFAERSNELADKAIDKVTGDKTNNA